MALVEVILAYRPYGFDGENPVPIGRTSDSNVVCTVRDCLLQEAKAQAHFWQEVDAGLAGLQLEEGERLRRLLAFLLPEQDSPDPLQSSKA